MKKNLVLILFLFGGFFSRNALAYTTYDTLKINALNVKSLDLAYSNPKKGLEIIKETILLSRKVGFAKGEIQALIRRGIIYDVSSNTENALKAYQEALILSRKEKYKKGEGSILNNIGLIYMNQHNLKEARIYFQKAFEIFEFIHNDQLLASISNNLGMIYEETERDQKALFWFRKGLNYASKVNDELEKGNIYGNIGDLYFEKIADSSLYYNLKAIEIYQKQGNKYYLGKSFNNIALVYKSANQNAEAEKYYLNSIEIAKEIGNKSMLLSSGYNLSQLYSSQKKSIQQIKILQEIYPLIEGEGMPELAYKICQALSKWNYQKGKIAEGDKFFNEFTKYHKAYFNEKSNENLNVIEGKYEVQKKNQENSLLKKSNQLKSLKIKKTQQQATIQNLLWTSGLVIILFISLLIFFWIRRKSYQKELENQQAIFEAKLAERKRISFDLHDNVGSQLSYVVNNLEILNDQSKETFKLDSQRIERTYKMSQEAIDSLRDTVWALHNSSITVELLASKMENFARKILDQDTSFTFNLSTIQNNVLSPEQTMHIFRIYQESIHNVLKHAEASEIDVNFFEDKANNLSLQVSDNGVGIDCVDSPEGHFGLKNMASRAKEIGGKFLVFKKEGGGTMLAFEIQL